MKMERVQASTETRYHNGTSIHLTLSISCQICLGKVKDPAICSNHHVFCSSCLDRWLENSAYCPACRVPINEENPYKKILGSFDDESNQDLMNDPLIKSQMRRTRLKMLFEEFQHEIEYLEGTIKSYSAENVKLKEENEELRLQLDERDIQTRLKLHDSIKNNNASSKTEENNVGDIRTILKLSNKLQEMISANESMSHVNAALRKDIKILEKERESSFKDIEKLKEENKFSQSPQKYNKYAMVALQTKVDNYEREVQQWKKALKRADDYIEELTLQLEMHKNKRLVSNDDSSGASVLDNESCGSANKTGRVSSSPTRSCTPVIMRSTSGISASETLINISSKKNTVSNDQGNTNISDDVIKQQGNPAFNDKSSSNMISHPDPLMSRTKEKTSEKVLTEPHLFPACAKLLELTKARQNMSPPGRESYSRNLFGYNRDELKVFYPKSSSCSPRVTMSSPSHTRAFQRDQGQDGKLLKRNLEGEDITVVIPSNEDQWLHADYRRTGSPRNPSYPAHLTSQSMEMIYKERIEYTEREGAGKPTIEHRQYYPRQVSPSPRKKIKTEDF